MNFFGFCFSLFESTAELWNTAGSSSHVLSTDIYKWPFFFISSVFIHVVIEIWEYYLFLLIVNAHLQEIVNAHLADSQP